MLHTNFETDCRARGIAWKVIIRTLLADLIVVIPFLLNHIVVTTFIPKRILPNVTALTFDRFLTNYAIWNSYNPIPTLPLFLLPTRRPPPCPRACTYRGYRLDSKLPNTDRRMCLTYWCNGSYSDGCVIWLRLDLCFVGNLSCA